MKIAYVDIDTKTIDIKYTEELYISFEPGDTLNDSPIEHYYSFNGNALIITRADILLYNIFTIPDMDSILSGNL